MTVIATFEKQPVEVMDYDVNCNAWLTSLSDTILSVSATVDSGITLVSCSHLSGIVKTWLSGGSDGVTYKVTLLITTSGGRVKQTEFNVRVKDT